MRNNSAIILAAGDGSRLKSSTPKVFHKVGGLSLLDHVIRAVKSAGVDDISVVIKPQYLDFPLEFENDVKKAFQGIPRGTGDAAKCGLSALKNLNEGLCYILYADIPLVSPITLLNMAEIFANFEKIGIVVLAMDQSGTKNLGKLVAGDEKGTVKAIIEAKDAEISGEKTLPLCNAGLLVKKSLLVQMLEKIRPSPISGECYLTEIVKLAHEVGYECRYHEASAQELSGVNTREELAQLERNFQNLMRKKIMDSGVTLVAPETVFFSYDTEIERDATVYPYVYFSKNVHISSGAKVGPFCVVEGASVKKATVGPFARLRSGAVIDDDAKIGNFVEIKNSEIHQGAKVNHLTYIGDAEIGKCTNIGAGTITCNYDGFKKYRTKVGENSFIGSNTAIVAPVEIADNTTIGAGSVVTKNVAAGELAIAREKQKNIPEWTTKFRKERDECAE